MKAEHSLDPFTFAAGTDFEMASAFFLQKIRQLAAKIRCVATNMDCWMQLKKKLNVNQYNVFVKLCRCIVPTFEAAEPAEPHKSACAPEPQKSARAPPPPHTVPSHRAEVTKTSSATEPADQDSGSWDDVFPCFFPMDGVDFVEYFLTKDSFLDRAESMALQAMVQVTEVDTPLPYKDDRSPTKMSKGPKMNPQAKRLKGSSRVGSECGPWWKKLSTNGKCPLKAWYDQDVANGLTISPKNFASRVYHKVDKRVGRAAAKRAHAEAVGFANSLLY